MKPLLHLVLAIVAASAATLSAASTTKGVRIPPVVGQTLSDKAFRLPADLPAKGAVLLLGFDRDHQAFIDDWTAGLAKVSADLIVLKVPVITPTNALSRNFIQFGMQRATPEGDPRDKTITVFTDFQAFATALRLPRGTQEPHAIAVDTEGNVLASASGRFKAGDGVRLAKVLTTQAPK